MTRPIVVCGAQKSCSTSFATALSDHEQVVMRSLECLALERRWGLSARSIARQALLMQSRAASLCVKRPEYLHVPELGRRAADVFVGATAVVILREPMSRFRSAFDHYRHLGLVNDASTTAYLERWMRHGVAAQDIRSQPGSFSFYASALESLVNAFDGRVDIFFQDDLLKDPHLCLKAVWRSAGLAEDSGDPDAGLPNLNIGSPAEPAGRIRMMGGRLAARTTRFGSVVPRRRPLRTMGSAILAVAPSCVTNEHVTSRPSSVTSDFSGLLHTDLARVEELVGRGVPAAWLVTQTTSS